MYYLTNVSTNNLRQLKLFRKSENNSQSLPDIEIIEEIQEEENDQEQEENVDDVPVIDLVIVGLYLYLKKNFFKNIYTYFQ